MVLENTHTHTFCGGVGGTVASESALRSAGTILSRVRAPPPAPWPDGGPESLRSPCCGLAIYKKKPNHTFCYLMQLIFHNGYSIPSAGKTDQS
ncbi:hypothetical protein PoB_007634400 [Plakobranchus ocellatus]|uniref:Uncharacterized protein n=1 Tax=Plakobranchus ocellatus TaxID=259542 RepID=A0AAV4E021_9GAST|nr:hypothetical protein PoB_007634400 [Plakobranchus ocellatus]